METKICCNCKEEKTIDSFLWRNKAKGIKHCQCNVCYKKIRKKNYDKNKQYYIEKNKKLTDRNIEWFNNYKKKLSCQECGEDHPACLDFHHRNPSDKTYEVSTMIRNCSSIETIIEEIKKCDVLCSNCHRKLHYNEKNGLIV